MKTKIKTFCPKTKGDKHRTDSYIETAAKFMRENKVSGLPVIDDKGSWWVSLLKPTFLMP